MQETEERNERESFKKKRKPRTPSEILDTPRRYLVSSGRGNYTLDADSRETAKSIALGNDVALMGTHEDRKHAEKRLGW